MKQDFPVHILLVEDNEGDIELLRIAFREGSMPCELRIASDGREALDLLQGQGSSIHPVLPDLILLDLNMPRMNGKEFLEAVKQDKRLQSIPVIVLTSSGVPRDVLDSYRLHANCYLLKPQTLDMYADLTRQIENFWLRLACLPDNNLAGSASA